MGGAPTARVEIVGGPQLRRALSAFSDRLDDLKDVHQAVGEIVAERAREIVPIGPDRDGHPGQLEHSIRPTRTKRGAAVKAGSKRAIYAGVIHFGWPRHNIEANPFLYDALDDRLEQVIHAYVAGVDKLIRRADQEMPK